METTGENLFQVKKERSYISCLVNGVSYGFKHLGMLLRYIWPGLVLTSLLPIPFMFFFAAQVDAILRKWIELGYLPNVTLKSMRRDIEKCANRSAITILIGILMLPIVFIGLCFLMMPIFMGWKYLWGVLVFLVIFIVTLPMVVVIMQIGYSDTPLKECFRSGYRIARRNFGSIFAFEFLSFLLGGLIVFLGSIPYQVILSVCIQAKKGLMMGDVLDLPTLFPFYVYLSAVIMIAVMLVTILLFSFSRCLMWGSLVKEVPAESEVNS